MYIETEMDHRREGCAGRSYQVTFDLNRNVQESYYLMTIYKYKMVRHFNKFNSFLDAPDLFFIVLGI